MYDASNIKSPFIKEVKYHKIQGIHEAVGGAQGKVEKDISKKYQIQKKVFISIIYSHLKLKTI